MKTKSNLRIITVVIFFFFVFNLTNAQDYIKLINVMSYYSEIIEDSDDYIIHKSNRVELKIPKSEIKLIEYLELGLVIYNEKYINSNNSPKDRESLFEKGSSVYVPFSSTKVVKRSGGLKLRELLKEDGFWNLVDCEMEADFIIEYLYLEKGRDKARIIIKDRTGNIIYESPKVSAKDFVPSHAGRESATKLYRRYIKKLRNK